MSSRSSLILFAIVPLSAILAVSACAAPAVAPAPTLAPASGITPALAPTTAAGAPAQQQQVVITLGPGRDATQRGTATLVAQGENTIVTLDLEPGEANITQLAHIHEGPCPGVGAVKYALTNLVNGKSVTVVNASLSGLLAGGYSINVHKSVGEPGIYTACAEVK